MIRIWAKKMKRSRMLEDYVAENRREDEDFYTRLEDCMEEICHRMDLAKPLWLDSNYEELNRFHRTRFHQDHFIEPIPFDYLEIEIIEMDDQK